MSDLDLGRRIERLKTVKSAFILEARSLSEQGLAAFARPLFRRAAEMECELADVFRLKNDSRNADVSLFSAGSCLVQARQFRSAAEILETVTDRFPEAQALIAECGDQDDLPVVAETPALQTLIELLVKKGLITEEDWVGAFAAR
jgi:hypothetical protein